MGKLRKAIYGMRETPHKWGGTEKKDMASLGHHASEFRPAVYSHRARRGAAVVHLGDFLGVGPSKALEWLWRLQGDLCPQSRHVGGEVLEQGAAQTGFCVGVRPQACEGAVERIWHGGKSWKVCSIDEGMSGNIEISTTAAWRSSHQSPSRNRNHQPHGARQVRLVSGGRGTSPKRNKKQNKQTNPSSGTEECLKINIRYIASHCWGLLILPRGKVDDT